MTSDPLLRALAAGGDHEVLRAGGLGLSAEGLLGAAAAARSDLGDARRIAVWMTAGLNAITALVAALINGREVVPLNPAAGETDLRHVLDDSAPDLFLHGVEDTPPSAVRAPRAAVDHRRRAAAGPPPQPEPEATALILYTSGTTGPPKGVMIPHRAIAANLDALARAWHWSAEDTVVHALPLFHAHGLVLGTLGPLRLGGRSHHVGRFSPAAVAAGLRGGGTMLFAVPTMYHRLAAEAQTDRDLAAALAGARLLVSGSAPLPVADANRVAQLTGRQVVERYGLTESLMCCAVRVDGQRRPGSVGPPLDNVEVRLADVEGPEHIGEILVRGPNLFTGYLNNPSATAEVMRDGWLVTGDMGTQDEDGYVRVIGRKSLDLVKTGGFRVGTGEIEASLVEHPAVAEAAVVGEPDEDLGQRIVAWVVLSPGVSASAEELTRHVAHQLAGHKRPRRVVFVDELPRNALGKVLKQELLAR